MQIYEKAIEDYAKRRKEEFDWELKHDIEEFILQVEQMTADGKCRNIKCDYCPVRMYQKMYGEKIVCSTAPHERLREVIAMETKE